MRSLLETGLARGVVPPGRPTRPPLRRRKGLLCSPLKPRASAISCHVFSVSSQLRDTPDGNVTDIFRAAQEGDQEAAWLLPLVYDELRKLAQARRARLPPGQALPPTALAHQARVVDGPVLCGPSPFLACGFEVVPQVQLAGALAPPLDLLLRRHAPAPAGCLTCEGKLKFHSGTANLSHPMRAESCTRSAATSPRCRWPASFMPGARTSLNWPAESGPCVSASPTC